MFFVKKYIIIYHENYKYSLKLIREADVVIVAGDRTKFTKHRMKDGKLTFVYSERIYKEKVKNYKLLIHFFRFAKKVLVLAKGGLGKVYEKKQKKRTARRQFFF